MGSKRRSGGISRSTSFSHGIKVRQGGLKKRPSGSNSAIGVSQKSTKEARTPFVGFIRPSAVDVRTFHSKLAKMFGERRPGNGRRRDILGTVIGTILSQNTTNTNSHMAFERLRKAFPTWDRVRLAKVKTLVETIRCAGLAPKKAPWIKIICQTAYKETGKTSLDHLRKMSKNEVHEYLCRFTGIGKKTAAIINLFDVGHPDMAVDTHVFRYAEQLGWVPSDVERARHNKKSSKR
jgi:endonuclease-3